MGWASGSSLFSEVIKTVESNVDDFSNRVRIYRGLIDVFEDHDCDTLDECVGEARAFDTAFGERYPNED